MQNCDWRTYQTKIIESEILFFIFLAFVLDYVAKMQDLYNGLFWNVSMFLLIYWTQDTVNFFWEISINFIDELKIICVCVFFERDY